MLANEKAIGLLVNTAKARAIKELDELVAAATEREEPMVEDEFKDERAYVDEDFDEAIAGLGDTEALQRARDEVSSKAYASWETIRRNNQSLLEPQNARVRQAKEELAAAVREEEAARAASLPESNPKGWLESASDAINLAKDFAPIVLEFVDLILPNPQPGPEPPGFMMGPRFYDGPKLGLQPAGTMNSNGSVSNVDGTSTDRNGGLHGLDGKWQKRN